MSHSLSKWCADNGVTIFNQPVYPDKVPEGWSNDSQHWKSTLYFQGRRLTVAFHQGSAHTKPPEAADVLSCIVGDAFYADETFEDFCGNCGYDPDSRKAEKIWKSCRALAPKVRRLLGKHFDTVPYMEY